MAKYITSDGHDWDDIVADKLSIVTQIKDHGLLYCFCLNAAVNTYNNCGNDVTPHIDYIFDYFMENNLSEEPAFIAGVHSLLAYIFENSESLPIEVMASNSIDDTLLQQIFNTRIKRINVENIQYDYDGVLERFAELYTIKFEHGEIMKVIATEKRIVVNSLSRFTIV